MLPPIALVVTFLALLITPIMSAPIMGMGQMTVHPLHAGIEKRSPSFVGHHYTVVPVMIAKRSISYHGHDPSHIPEPRTTDDLDESVRTKRADGRTMVRLVRRKSKILEKLKAWGRKAKENIKKGFNKIATWAKEKLAPVVKFATKIVAGAASLIGRVVKLPVFKIVAEGISKVANLVSDHIPGKLPAKLQKGVDVMKRIKNFGKKEEEGGKRGKGGKVGSALLGMFGKRDFVENGLRKDPF